MVTQLIRRGPDPSAIRGAAWVARCVGRGDTVPLGPEDIAALASYLQPRSVASGTVLFAAGTGPAGVSLIRSGLVELTIGSGRRRAVLAVLRPGDVDGDIAMLLGMVPPYTARALEAVDCLYLAPRRLRAPAGRARATGAPVAHQRRGPPAHSQSRLIGLLGANLTAQTARLLLDEADEQGRITLSQATIAAMLGARRPSVNKVLGELAGASSSTSPIGASPSSTGNVSRL